MKRLILGIAGEAGSGKDAAAQYIHKKYGAYVYTFSAPLRDLVERLYLPITRQNLSSLSTSLRTIFGEDLFGRVAMKDIEESTHPIVIVTGIRRPQDMSGLTLSKDFRLMFIDADPKTRYERIHVRGQNQDDATKTYEEFLKENELETERTIRGLRADAAHVLDNSGDMGTLEKKLDECMGQYGYDKTR